MKYLALLFFALFASCATTIGVEYDYETNFSKYKTYNYYPEMVSKLDAVEESLIIKVADKMLPAENMSRSEIPQIYINFYVNERATLSKNTVTVGFVPIGKKVNSQQFVFEFLDASNGYVLWRAVAHDEMKLKATHSEKEKYYTGILQKIFEIYPPNNDK